MNLWAIVHHQRLPKETGLGCGTRDALEEKLQVDHQRHISAASAQSFLPFTSEGAQRRLKLYLPYDPARLSQDLFPGQHADQGFDNSEAVGALGLLPITLTALPHCFPL